MPLEHAGCKGGGNLGICACHILVNLTFFAFKIGHASRARSWRLEKRLDIHKKGLIQDITVHRGVEVAPARCTHMCARVCAAMPAPFSSRL